MGNHQGRPGEDDLLNHYVGQQTNTQGGGPTGQAQLHSQIGGTAGGPNCNGNTTTQNHTSLQSNSQQQSYDSMSNQRNNQGQTGPGAGTGGGGPGPSMLNDGGQTNAIRDKLKVYLPTMTNPEALTMEEVNSAMRITREVGLSVVSGTPLCNRLYGLLQRRGQGRISFEQLCLVMSTLYAGTIDDKINLTFACYDTMDAGSVEKEVIMDLFAESWLYAWKLMSEYLDNQRKSSDKEIPSHSELANFALKTKDKVRKAVEMRLERAYHNAGSQATGTMSTISREEFRAFVNADDRLDITSSVGPESLHVAVDFVHIAGFVSPAIPPVTTNHTNVNQNDSNNSQIHRDRNNSGGSGTNFASLMAAPNNNGNYNNHGQSQVQRSHQIVQNQNHNPPSSPMMVMQNGPPQNQQPQPMHLVQNQHHMVAQSQQNHQNQMSSQHHIQNQNPSQYMTLTNSGKPIVTVMHGQNQIHQQIQAQQHINASPTNVRTMGMANNPYAAYGCRQ